MRTLSLILLGSALCAGAAQAQIALPASDPLLEQRFRVEVQRLEANQRAFEAVQFRQQGEIVTRQLEASVANEVDVTSPDAFAPYRATSSSPEMARRRAEQLRQQRVERGLQQMRTPRRR
jgi:hypothetical protein